MSDFTNEEMARLISLSAIELEMLRRQVGELRPFQRAFVLLEAVITHAQPMGMSSPDRSLDLERAAEQLRRSPPPGPVPSEVPFDPWDQVEMQALRGDAQILAWVRDRAEEGFPRAYEILAKFDPWVGIEKQALEGHAITVDWLSILAKEGLPRAREILAKAHEAQDKMRREQAQMAGAGERWTLEELNKIRRARGVADQFEQAHRQKLKPENSEPVVFDKDETPADQTFHASVGHPVDNRKTTG